MNIYNAFQDISGVIIDGSNSILTTWPLFKISKVASSLKDFRYLTFSKTEALFSLSIECLKSTLKTWIRKLDLWYHTLCNPDNVAFKPTATLSSHLIFLPSGQWQSVIFSHPDAVNSFLSISLLNLFSPQDAFWSFSVWFVLAASSGSRHSHLMAGCLRSTVLFPFLWSVNPRRILSSPSNSHTSRWKTLNIGSPREMPRETGACPPAVSKSRHLRMHLNWRIHSKLLIYSKCNISPCRQC